MPLRDQTTARTSHVGRCRIVALICCLAFGATVAAAAERVLVRVMDAAGERVTDGSVVFCPLDDDCLECPVNAAGAFALDLARLVPGKPYTCIVYDPRRTVRFAAFDWVYDPALFALRDGAAGELTLRGDDRKQASFVYAPRAAAPPGVPPSAAADPPGVAPAPRAAATPPAAPAAIAMVPRPRVVLGAVVTFLFGGRFGADPDALGGVLDVSPGLGGYLGVRFGYPGWSGAGPVTFREVGLTYAANRYTVRGLIDPASTSDVTFHRAALSFGLGRASARTEFVGALAAGYGGIYDGRRRLTYDGRDYGMLGFGLQGRAALWLTGSRTRGLALLGVVDLMHYPADEHADDHWYGLAPALGVGLLLR